MRYALAQASRIGARRVNEDRIGSWATSEALLLAVADGLGGHLYGEVAADLAMRLLGSAFCRAAQPRIADPALFFVQVIAEAHAALLDEARLRALGDTPRTVLVGCLVQDGRAYWTHVGDSRFYLIRDGRIVHRTRDHTVVQRLVDAGRLSESAAGWHPERNLLLQCLGSFQPPRPEALASAVLVPGDIVLLCSDGLWGPLGPQQLVDGLAGGELDAAVTQLSLLAERRAGAQCDNVTLLAMQWTEE